MKDNYWPAFFVAVAVALGYFLLQKDVAVEVKEPQEENVAAVNETIEFVSLLDKIHPSEIKVVSFEEVEWPDRCLGLPMPGESDRCVKAPIQGFRVTLEADGKQMIFRTNKDGSSIRRDLLAEKSQDQLE